MYETSWPSESLDPKPSKRTVSPARGEDGETVNEAIGGKFPGATTTDRLVSSVVPSSSATVRMTAYVAGAVNTCWTLAPAAIAPSPKSQAKETILPSGSREADASKRTRRGACPLRRARGEGRLRREIREEEAAAEEESAAQSEDDEAPAAPGPRLGALHPRLLTHATRVLRVFLPRQAAVRIRLDGRAARARHAEGGGEEPSVWLDRDLGVEVAGDQDEESRRDDEHGEVEAQSVG